MPNGGRAAASRGWLEWWADFRVEAGADLAAVAGAVGQGVFAAGLKALDEKLRR